MFCIGSATLDSTSQDGTTAEVQTTNEFVSSPTDTEEPEPNTSAMIDYIAQQAKTAVAESVTDSERDEAVAYIAEHYPTYFTNNEIMEQTMYYEYWLDYAYGQGDLNTYANLGIDTYIAVKGYYRNQETLDSSIVQGKLREISESLQELGYDVIYDEEETPAEVMSDVSGAVGEVAEETEPTTTTSVEITEAITTEATAEVTAEQQEMVWIPSSGSKYHSKSSCSGMEAPRQVTKQEAEAMGYSPCKRCY